jgi:hypothetical protein
MRKKLIFIVPILLLLGFLAIKPPAIGSEKSTVVVTPTSTTTATPVAQPDLRDFDDHGNGPSHPDDDGDWRDGHHENHHDGDHHDLHESDDD